MKMEIWENELVIRIMQTCLVKAEADYKKYAAKCEVKSYESDYFMMGFHRGEMSAYRHCLEMLGKLED